MCVYVRVSSWYLFDPSYFYHTKHRRSMAEVDEWHNVTDANNPGITSGCFSTHKKIV